MNEVQTRRMPLGIYLHIPFCIRKCLYCDFLSAPGDDGLIEEYVQALLAEIRAQAELYGDYEVRTVFFGGGTPSLLSGGQVAALMEALAASFCFAEGQAEITMEANPGTLSKEKLRAYKKAGINRLSIGLQSAHDEELRALGRIHDWRAFLDTYHGAREAGYDNVNVDLMSALPGQTAETWMDSLEKVCALEPEHISAYSLIIEEGTPFYERYGEGGSAQGKWPPLPSEEEDRLMYAQTKEFLARKGYTRYEISNYARPGRACRHNLSYWKRTDYAGFGLGAASLRQNVRWSNTRVLGQYLEQAGERGLQTALKREFSPLTTEEQMEEFMFLGLRLGEGIQTGEFARTFGRTVEEVYGEALAKLEREGLLLRDPRSGHIRLTDLGIDVSNYALAEFLLT